MLGTRVRDGASIRAEQQVRRLNRRAGQQRYYSEIRRTFPNKLSAYRYEQRYIATYRRLFGRDTLPGNKGVH